MIRYLKEKSINEGNFSLKIGDIAENIALFIKLCQKEESSKERLEDDRTENLVVIINDAI